MNHDTDTPTVYLKRTCPFCLKLLIFLTEAGVADRCRLVVFDDSDDMHRGLRARLAAAGQQASFPAAEIEPGRLQTGTDELIERFSADMSIEKKPRPLLDFYGSGVFPEHIKMFRELHRLNSVTSPQPA